MVPLEITHTALVTQNVLARIESPKTQFTKIMSSMLKFYRNSLQTFMSLKDPPLHDPCAVAFLIDPSLFEYRLMRVDMETHSPLTSGQTICDIYSYYSSKKKNVNVCLTMNVEKFWEMMIQGLMEANTISPATKA